jgi:type I restriction enzyme S subunit
MSEWKETAIGRIPASWEIKTFGTLLKENVRNGIYKSKEFHGYGSRIVNMGELFAYPRIGNQEMKKVFLTEAEKAKNILKKGDLLFARRSLTIEGAGKCVIVEESDDNLSFESSIIRARPDSKIANSEYLYFLFDSRIGKYLLGTILRVVAVAGITGSDLMTLEVPLPPLKEQKEIAKTLSLLDQKTTLLRQQNQDLEELAQTLFKRWFVEFEFPNENGEPYLSSGGKMVESELGEIPEGWRVGKLNDEFDILMGQSPSGSSFNEIGDGEIFYQGRTDFGFRFPTNRLFTNEPKRIANKFDVLVSVRAPVGDVNMANERCCIGRGLASVKSELKSYCFNKLKWMKASFDVFEKEGTVFGSLSKNDFNDLETIVPINEIKVFFDNTVSTIDLKIFNSSEEIQSLTQLRDTLLPKLMSGELKVNL